MGSGRRNLLISKTHSWILLFSLLFCIEDSVGFPEQGKWDFILNPTQIYSGVHKSLFRNSKIFIKVQCQPGNLSYPVGGTNITIAWKLRETKCYEEYSKLDLMNLSDKQVVWQNYFENPNVVILSYAVYPQPREWGHRLDNQLDRCDNTIHLLEHVLETNATTSSDVSAITDTKDGSSGLIFLHKITESPVFTVPDDGVYLLIVKIMSVDDSNFNATVHVEMQHTPHGYLSASDWPLLPVQLQALVILNTDSMHDFIFYFISQFYGFMCIMYLCFAIIWLILSFCQWRDLLRIQFWIGAVIFLGMLEMAVFYAEYQSVNYSGSSVAGALLFAEIVSCAKRTLARMLIVIVSIGFGIVKPRLGETLNRIVFIGGLFFILASTEAYYRVIHPDNGTSTNKVFMAQVPLSLLDAGICWWIFQSLLTTTRTLRLRRNLVKLGLYRNFTNTLLFAVIVSVAFMIWSIKYLKSASCLRDWKELWLDQAFWHIQFSIILLAIMILWRPTNNNQRYSFSPLIDNPDDEDEEDLVVNESFGNMKLRSSKNSYEKLSKNRNTIEDELRWVEENIPADLAEGDIPGIDSEEELISTKFELSKMQ